MVHYIDDAVLYLIVPSIDGAIVHLDVPFVDGVVLNLLILHIDGVVLNLIVPSIDGALLNLIVPSIDGALLNLIVPSEAIPLPVCCVVSKAYHWSSSPSHPFVIKEGWEEEVDFTEERTHRNRKYYFLVFVLLRHLKVTVEIYLLQAMKDILPHDVKHHISIKKRNSKLLTPKSKVSELKAVRVQSPAGLLAVCSPQFLLQQAARKTFTLNKVPCGSPLEGSVHVEIRARLRVSAPAPHAAFLTAFDDVSGLGAWHRRWFRLTSPRLQYWKYPDDANRKMPIGDIDLSTVLSDRVVRAPRDLCARPNTLLVETSVPVGLACPDSGSLIYRTDRPDGQIVRRHLLAADTPKDRDDWLECLNKALEYVRCCATDDD